MLSEVIAQLAADITKARQYHYSNDQLEQFVQSTSNTVSYRSIRIRNNRGDLLDCALLHRDDVQNHTCILYAHGLGSNKLQMLPVARRVLKEGYDVFSFDFSASGMSQGSYTSFGVREQDDITAVLAWLDSTRLYKQYVLWGRSMGAAAILLNQTSIPNPKVLCLILDSPFSSFERVALELASKKSYIPEFILGIMLEPLKLYFSTKYPFNPFSINLTERIGKVRTKMLFIHSQNDSVISNSHTKQLISACSEIPKEVIIEEDHNMTRSRDTLQQAIKFIQRLLLPETRCSLAISRKRKGISVTSKDERNDTKNTIRYQTPDTKRTKIRLSMVSQNVCNNSQSRIEFDSVGTFSFCNFSTSSKCSKTLSKRPNFINSIVLEGTKVANGKQNQFAIIKPEVTPVKAHPNRFETFVQRLPEGGLVIPPRTGQFRQAARHRNALMPRV